MEPNNFKAAFFVVIAMSMITTNDAIVKHITQVFNVGQIMFLRGALICVISDTCGHCWPELELHIRFARRQGWTEDELSEALLHLGGYIGVPSIREAMIIAGKVFEELREEDG